MYGTQGICKITDITKQDFMGEQKEYYVIKPMCDEGATLFAPVHNEKVESKMRAILTKEEVHQFIESMEKTEMLWVESDNQRKDQYNKIIAIGKHAELIQILKALYFHKQEREAVGKRLYLSDERFLKEAERILYEEFQYVLGIERNELISLISKKINVNMW